MSQEIIANLERQIEQLKTERDHAVSVRSFHLAEIQKQTEKIKELKESVNVRARTIQLLQVANQSFRYKLARSLGYAVHNSMCPALAKAVCNCGLDQLKKEL